MTSRVCNSGEMPTLKLPYMLSQVLFPRLARSQVVIKSAEEILNETPKQLSRITGRHYTAVIQNY